MIADLSGRPVRNATTALIVVAWLAFQWGLGNDVLLPVIAARVYNGVDSTGSLDVGLVAIVTSTLAGGVFWALTQLLDVVVVLSAFKLVPRLGRRLGRWVVGRFGVVSFDQMRWSTRWLIAYSTGASVLCVLDALATGDFGITSRRRVVGRSVALSAGSVAIVIAVVTAATMLGRRHPSLQPAADAFATYAAIPWTWILLFLTLVIAKKVAQRVGRLAGRGSPRSRS